MKAKRAIAAITIVVAFFLLLSPGTAYLDDRGDFLPNGPTATIKAVMERGYGLYRLDSRASSWPGFRERLWEFYGQQCEFTGLCWFEAAPGEAFDLVHTMPDTFPYGPGIAGVAWYTLYPSRIEYNWRLGYYSWASTNAHEHGHIDLQEDLYNHALLQCLTSRTWTRQSCGTGVKTVQPYDRDIVWNVFIPDIPSFAEATRLNANTIRLSYTGVRKSSSGCTFNDPLDNCGGHFSPWLDNVTRVAIFKWDGNQWQWIGYGPAPAKTGLTSVDIQGGPGLYAIHPESNIRATWFGWPESVSFLSGDLYQLEVK